MNYNYVIFNYTDDSSSFNEEEDYYAICLRDLKDREDVILNHFPLQERSFFTRKLYGLSFSRLFNNSLWKIPVVRLWYPFVYKNTFKNDKPICFVCLRYPPLDYLYYLKKTHPSCKIVKMSRDLIRTQLPLYEEYSKAKIFDLWLSYDESDCEKYGFHHFDEFESLINIKEGNDFPESDVFSAGRAKDRLKYILDIYDVLSSGGLKCLFYIVGAKEEEKEIRNGIIYAEKPMTYIEMLKYSVKSRCLLDINQKNAVGYTSRFLESVLFNKYLITNNSFVKNSKYYTPEYISIIDTAKDIDPSFIKTKDVDYKYDGGFSPLKRIELIDGLLAGKE